MIDATSGTLHVPGADLYHRVRGTGPLLLIVTGGSGDADPADNLAAHLVDHYTVVTHDRRGLSRSRLDDPAEHPTVETHSDDIHRLLSALTTEPAFVLGTSLGALIALDLLVRWPEQVHTLVAHEPPAPSLLPDGERAQAQRIQKQIEGSTRSATWAATMRKIAVDHADREPGVGIPAPTEQMVANAEFFRTRDAPSAHHYELDVTALADSPARIVAAGGERSRDAFPYRCARALADRLGIEFAEFPGDHAGFATRPEAFAAKLREVLTH